MLDPRRLVRSTRISPRCCPTSADAGLSCARVRRGRASPAYLEGEGWGDLVYRDLGPGGGRRGGRSAARGRGTLFCSRPDARASTSSTGTRSEARRSPGSCTASPTGRGWSGDEQPARPTCSSWPLRSRCSGSSWCTRPPTGIIGTEYLVVRAVHLAAGIGHILRCASRIRYTAWRRYAPALYVVVLLSLVLVLVPGIGTEIGGARRWFDVWSREPAAGGVRQDRRRAHA